MKGGKGLYGLDFDGVVCQSTDECMITAYNAWRAYSGDGGIAFRSVGDIPSSEVEVFRRWRGYVRGGAEYYVLMRAIKEGFPLNGQDHFTGLAKQWADELWRFGELFYQSRESFMAEDQEHWFRLHTVFPEVKRELVTHLEDERTLIVTMKDRDSVVRILAGEEIPFPDERVYDKDDFATKAAALAHLADRYGVPHRAVHFLDDNIMHLIEPRAAGFDVYFALWGYHTPEHLRIREREGIRELTINAIGDFFRD